MRDSDHHIAELNYVTPYTLTSYKATINIMAFGKCNPPISPNLLKQELNMTLESTWTKVSDFYIFRGK